MTNAKRILAIIPARGGSKRIPRKNITEFDGLPMIAWTIKAALESDYITDVMVSTDDEEIAAISMEYGAKCPFLRDKLADDHSTVSDVTIYHLQKMQDLGTNYDVVVQLMPNCPNRGIDTINRSILAFFNSETNFLISCVDYGWLNPWWAHKIEDNKAVPVFDQKMLQSRSQDQPKLYCPSGAIWIAEVAALQAVGTFYGPDYNFFPLNWFEAVDIDNYDDLKMALVAKRLKY